MKTITVIKFGVNDGGGDGTGCFGIRVRTDEAKLRHAEFGDRCHLVRKGLTKLS